MAQLARYCVNQGIEFGLLTNGCDWLLIKTFEKGTQLRDRIIWQVSLEDDSPIEVQARLSTISVEQIGKLSELIEKEKQLDRFWVDFVSGNTETIGRIASELSKDFLEANVDEDYEAEAVSSFFKTKLRSFLTEKPVQREETIDTPKTSHAYSNLSSQSRTEGVPAFLSLCLRGSRF